jgi:short-subunit dehydrogenase
VRADLGTYGGVEDLWKQVEEIGRPLDVAVLNAGMSIGGAFATDTDLEDELKLIALNVNAVVHLAKRVTPAMLARGAGRILITSSISALTPTPYETVYGPTKAFGYSFAQSLREELRDTGVTVTALLPGATDSDFHARAGMGSTSIGKGRKNDKRQVAKQGVDALIAGKDEVVGGDAGTKRQAFISRFLPESFKAHRQGIKAKP